LADLSAYINFSVRLDYTQNKILLTDTSTYHVGVDVNITGKFDITHPDLIPEVGSWTLPDVTYVSGALTTSLRELRRSSANLPQTGVYTITYTIDHPSYVPTVLTKTFNLQFAPVTGSITKNFDVFTPALTVSDTAVYTVANFTTTSTTRSWVATVGTVDTLMGSSSTLDLAVSGNYYDAAYVITLGTTLIYTHTTDTWLSVKWLVSASLNASANTPPDTCEMLAYLNTLKARLDLLIGACQPYDTAKKTYEYAADLYFHILERLKAGTTIGVIDYVNEFLVLYYNAIPATINTNSIIPPYTFCYATGGSGSGGSTVIKVFALMNSTVTDYTNPNFSDGTLLLAASEGFIIKDTFLSLSGSTVSFTNGDQFEDTKWYVFLIVKAGAATITKLHVSMIVDSVDYTNAAFSGKELLLTTSERFVLKDTDISLVSTTVSKTVSGDQFFAGTWYTFILKS
jgi:hypothetical protein